MNIDFKKILAEDAGFAEFVKECSFELTKSNTEALKFIYSAYASGVSAQELVKMMRYFV